MVINLLAKRRSVRSFAEKNVPKETIRHILEAGRLSPSGGNEQPWKFGVITDKALIAAISKAAYDQAWIAGASFLIVLCTTAVPGRRGGRDVQKARFPERSAEIEQLETELYRKLHQEEHQTKIPGSHMVLAALEQGVGSCWVSLFAVDEVAALLGLPAGTLPSEIIAFGYPKTEAKPAPKKSLDEIVFYNRF